MVPTITSFSNPLIKKLKTLHRTRGRRDLGLTLVEGPTVFAQMTAAGVIPETILVIENDSATMELCRTQGWTAVVVPEEILTSASDTMHPQSPIASIAVPNAGPIRSRDTLMLKDISDPGNVGTMIRSAAAFGWDVCVSGSTADPWSPKALRAGVGSHFGLHLSSAVDPIVEAHAAGLEVLAAVVKGGGQVARSDLPIALLVGSEAHGLPDEIARLADRPVTLSMPGGAESLNAAVAASVLMYALS